MGYIQRRALPDGEGDRTDHRIRDRVDPRPELVRGTQAPRPHRNEVRRLATFAYFQEVRSAQRPTLPSTPVQGSVAVTAQQARKRSRLRGRSLLTEAVSRHQ